MYLKTFTITGTHKRTGEKRQFTMQAKDYRSAITSLQQKYNQDFSFNLYKRG